ncbi:MAG TPA: hypothetical protein VG838_06310 [Opitutaceae bacterium]|nr:hypothetical protein [Opitutaceae bacterium]
MKKKTKTSKAPAPAKPAAKSTRTTAAPAVKKSAPKAVVTAISAQVNVGFGNTLYIRGVGPGLSWDKGVAMNCVADDRWSVTVADAANPIVCKFLINDLIWCAGDDFVIAPGTKMAISPVF